MVRLSQKKMDREAHRFDRRMITHFPKEFFAKTSATSWNYLETHFKQACMFFYDADSAKLKKIFLSCCCTFFSSGFTDSYFWWWSCFMCKLAKENGMCALFTLCVHYFSGSGKIMSNFTYKSSVPDFDAFDLESFFFWSEQQLDVHQRHAKNRIENGLHETWLYTTEMLSFHILNFKQRRKILNLPGGGSNEIWWLAQKFSYWGGINKWMEWESEQNVKWYVTSLWQDTAL